MNNNITARMKSGISTITTYTKTAVSAITKISPRTIALWLLGIIILIALIIIITDWFSPKNILGIQQRKHIYAIQQGVTPTSEYDTTLFQNAELIAESIVVHYPVTGITSLDTTIQAEAQRFGAEASTAGSAKEYNYYAYGFDKYVFITWTPADTTTTGTYRTIGVSRNGVIAGDGLLQDGYKNVAIASASQTLAQRFNAQLEVTTALVTDAITNKTLRMASNGLVLIIPTASLPASAHTTPTLEVLVPISELEQFLR